MLLMFAGLLGAPVCGLYMQLNHSIKTSNPINIIKALYMVPANLQLKYNYQDKVTQRVFRECMSKLKKFHAPLNG